MSGDNTKLLEKKYKLTVDASDAGVDTVLLQERKDEPRLDEMYITMLQR
jgi:hypothetical protein